MTRITHDAGFTLPRAEDWRDEGLCRAEGESPEDWFPTGHGNEARAAQNHAQAVCHRCPVRAECAGWALDTREAFGVWGGLTEAQRRAILRRRGQGNGTPHAPKTTEVTS